MFTKNIKDFKNASYIFLILLSIAGASDTAPLPNGYINQAVVGGSIEVPYGKESFIDSLEKRVKLLFEDYNTREDEAQRDIQAPPMDASQEKYTRLKNNIIDKYEKDRPELARFKTPSSRKNGKSVSELEKASREFATQAEQARQRSEKEDEEIQKVGETTVNVAHSLLEAVIDTKVNDPAKNVLLGALNNAKEGILSFFKQ